MRLWVKREREGCQLNAVSSQGNTWLRRLSFLCPFIVVPSRVFRTHPPARSYMDLLRPYSGIIYIKKLIIHDLHSRKSNRSLTMPKS